MELKELRRVKFSNTGKGCRMWLGDVNSDGRMEIIMVQPDCGFDDRYFPHSVECATAFDLDGNTLWQIGTPNPEVKGSGSDIPAQVYDIDGDGNLEFICAMHDELRIYDGKTGALKASHALPDPNAHDCIIIADLEGLGRPQNIILKNRYEKVWALDRNFNVMWTHEGNVGHYPWPIDLNGDGRDELVAGYSVLDGDGKLLFNIDMKDHADCIWTGDINGDGRPELVIGGDDITAYSPEGELLWRYNDTVESQNVAIGNLRSDLDGLEICGLDRIDRSANGLDGIFLIDSKGNTLYKEHRTVPGWSSICTVAHNLDGEGSDYILAYRRGGGMPNAIYDGHLNTVFSFPFDGYVMWGDLAGSGINQLIVYSDDEAVIYSAKEVSLEAGGNSVVQPKRLYNNTRYWGGDYAG